MEALDLNSRARSVFIILLLLIAALIAGLAWSLWSLYGGADVADEVEMIEAPSVVRMTKEDATRFITTEGLTVGAITDEFHDTIAEGTVISQDPEAGEEIELGSAMKLTVSKGSGKDPEQVKVPDLTGMTQVQAEETLDKLSLIAVPTNPEFTTAAIAGQVFKQSVAPGTAVEKETTVSFTTALGVETALVPNVLGITRDAATTALTNAGFGIDAHDEYNATVPVGNVVTQNPYPQVTCAKGTTVFITISKGARPVNQVQVPDLGTLTMTQALQITSSAGLVLNPGGSDLNGTVVRQDPARGTMVVPGTKISATFEPVDLIP